MSTAPSVAYESRFKNLPWIAMFVLGFTTWTAFGALTQRREAWDDPLYFFTLLPVLSILAGVAGWLSPRRAWLVAPALAVSQLVALFVQNPGGSNLWPITLVLLAMLHVPALLLALLGSWMRRRSMRLRAQ
jgi:peptidoglycan/LPS O-acetylase OafA/YrhL